MTTPDEIIAFFNHVDTLKKQSGNYVRNTDKGIFGVSGLRILNDFFKKISLSEENVFVDLGSGDGRVNILASLYCESIGLEFDNELVLESKNNNEKLQTFAKFFEQDYENFDFSKTTTLFSFADHFFSEKFIQKLKNEFKGKLYVYQGIFTPENIPKGKTIWIEQTPIFSYNF